MINVRVWRGETPPSWIFREVRDHILVNKPLKIHAQSPVGANDNVRAGAEVRREVAAGIGDPDIAAIVEYESSALRSSRVDERSRTPVDRNRIYRVAPGQVRRHQGAQNQIAAVQHGLSFPFSPWDWND